MSYCFSHNIYLFSSLFVVAVSNHILPKSVQSSTWNGIKLQNDAALQDVDVSLESGSSVSSSESDHLHHLAEQGMAGRRHPVHLNNIFFTVAYVCFICYIL